MSRGISDASVELIISKTRYRGEYWTSGDQGKLSYFELKALGKHSISWDLPNQHFS